MDGTFIETPAEDGNGYSTPCGIEHFDGVFVAGPIFQSSLPIWDGLTFAIQIKKRIGRTEVPFMRIFLLGAARFEEFQGMKK